jgi:hypothetical protein
MLLAVELAYALGVDSVSVLSDGATRWGRFVEGVRKRFPALSLYAFA